MQLLGCAIAATLLALLSFPTSVRAQQDPASKSRVEVFNEYMARQAEVRKRMADFLVCLPEIANEQANGDALSYVALLDAGYRLSRGDQSDVAAPKEMSWVAQIRHEHSDPAYRRRLESLIEAGTGPRGTARAVDCEKFRPSRERQVLGVKVVGTVTSEFSDVMGFLKPGANTAFCSGALVSKKHRAVLTAAHCVCPRRNGIRIYAAHETEALNRRRSGANPSDYTMSRDQTVNECSRTTCAVAGSDTSGPKFPIIGAVLLYRDSCAAGEGSAVPGKDLALAFLEPIVEQDETTLTMNYTDNDMKQDAWSDRIIVDASSYQKYGRRDGAGMEVVGFGRTGGCPTLEKINVDKRRAFVPFRSFDCTTSYAQQYFGCVPGHEAALVATERDPLTTCYPDTCGGDSGGPAYIKVHDVKNEKDYLYLAAITSRGIPGREDVCGRGGVYSLVTPEVIRWMKAWGVDVLVRPSIGPTVIASPPAPVFDSDYADMVEQLDGENVLTPFENRFGRYLRSR
jgi:V8-like Glu-specific endopeptidase